MRPFIIMCLLMTACVLSETGTAFAPERACGKKRIARDEHACHCDRECQSGTVCLSEYAFGYPQGSCTHLCETDEECDEGYACSPSGVCRALCTAHSDCSQGRLCFFGETQGPVGLCRPFCDEDADCENGACNFHSGRCYLYGERPRGAGLNGACKEDDDCLSQRCRGGVCITFCDPAFARCPDDGLCVGNLCRNSCAVTVDCAAGQSCLGNEDGMLCSLPREAEELGN